MNKLVSDLGRTSGSVRFLFKDMLSRQQKQQIIEQLSEKLKAVKSAIFVDYKGLKVSELKDLRKKLKPLESELKVVKKTLIDLAIKKAGFENISSKNLVGQIGLALGYKDEVSAAKTLHNFSKKNENLKILGAILEGKFLEQNEAIALAKVPTREQSLAQLIGTIKAPISGLALVLSGNMRKLVFVLSQIKN